MINIKMKIEPPTRPTAFFFNTNLVKSKNLRSTWKEALASSCKCIHAKALWNAAIFLKTWKHLMSEQKNEERRHVGGQLVWNNQVLGLKFSHQWLHAENRTYWHNSLHRGCFKSQKYNFHASFKVINAHINTLHVLKWFSLKWFSLYLSVVCHGFKKI